MKNEEYTTVLDYVLEGAADLMKRQSNKRSSQLYRLHGAIILTSSESVAGPISKKKLEWDEHIIRRRDTASAGGVVMSLNNGRSPAPLVPFKSGKV